MITDELRADCLEVFIVRGLTEFAPPARIPAKAVRVEDDGAFLANRPEKETDRRENKAGEEETDATSICQDIILVHICK